jgi:hypothetical protein
MTTAKAIDLAMGEARQYRGYSERGDVVLARETRRTIDELAGRRVAGRWVLPQCVADAMGRPELGADRAVQS